MLFVSTSLAASVWGDLRSRKISNRLVIATFVVAVAYLSIRGGLGSLGTGLISTVLAFAITLPLYLTKVLGGGDLKIFTAAATLMSWQVVVATAIAALFWGSLLGVLRALLSGQGKSLYHNLFAIVVTRTKPAEQNLHKIPYSVALLFGYLSSFVYLGAT
jgi:Flp pilus assembly protein protease CpaA